jgi:hypothetical protein
MEKMMRKLRHDDEGVAMITAILVTMVVMMLGVVSVQMAIHNSESSGFDKRRVLAVAAAEGGLDYYSSHLASNNIATIQCTVSSTLTNAGTFAVTTTFYDSVGNPLPTSGGSQCPLNSMPASVLVKSVGRAQANKNPARTMQALYELSPATTAPFNNAGAITAQSSVSFEANANIGGSKYADADVFANGDISVSANSVLYGNLFAQGNVTLQSNSEVKKDLWANGSITMKGNSRVRGNATSSTSFISMTAQSRIYGNARAATSITSGIVSGTRTPNSPTDPPPSKPYPGYTYNASDWIAAGYTVRNYTDCVQAVADVVNWWGQSSGNNVVRVTGGCLMNFTTSVTVKGNLGIVNDGSITIATNSKFSPATGTGPWDVLFFTGMNGVTPCAFTANPNGGMKSGLNTLVWTHQNCSVVLDSNSALSEGQIIGGNVNVKHNISFQYKQVSVPGISGGGLKQDLRYKREIVTS